jgi:hypothetical protein
MESEIAALDALLLTSSASAGGVLAALAKLAVRLFAEVRVPLPATPTEIASILIALAHGIALQRRSTAEGHADPSGRMIRLILNQMLRASD